MTGPNRNTLFRQSTLERLNSPEQLNDYIRVARPGVWLVLGAIVLLLTGVIVWGIFGTVSSTVTVGLQAENSTAVCYVSAEDAAQLSAGMPVSVAGKEAGRIASISTTPTRVEAVSYALSLSGLTEEAYVCEVTVQGTGLADGVYRAEITLEQLHPASFVVQ